MSLDTTRAGLSNADEPIALMKPELRPSLDGVTLEAIVTRLSKDMGWEAMAVHVPVRCFTNDPTIKSSLKFLRRTPWAREKLEQLYLRHARSMADCAKSNADSNVYTKGDTDD